MQRYFAVILFLSNGFSLFSQATGTLTGTVVLDAKGTPLHHATITVGPIGRSVETKDDGTYEVTGLPPGTYTITAHMHALSDQSQTVQIPAGGLARADFKLRLSPVKQEITVTASGREQTTFESFQTVTSIESLELAAKSETSLGEVLEHEPGVAKR